jgi:hypothetical protein
MVSNVILYILSSNLWQNNKYVQFTMFKHGKHNDYKNLCNENDILIQK